MSVFGKYLSKMKLKQWQNYGWADSEKLAAENAERRAVNLEERKQFEAEIKEKYEKGEIGKAEYETLVSTETLNTDYMEMDRLSAITRPVSVSFILKNLQIEIILHRKRQLFRDDF